MSKITLKALVGFFCLVMGAMVTILAFFLPDKALFTTFATAWVVGGVSVLVNFFYGNSHKEIPPSDPGSPQE